MIEKMRDRDAWQSAARTARAPEAKLPAGNGAAKRQRRGALKGKPLDVEEAAARLERLARQMHTMGFINGLKPAQWSALRYIARSEADLCTLTDFAIFHAATKGAASQTLTVMLKKKLVNAAVDRSDRRVRRLSLTERGRQMLRQDPMRKLIAALGQLSENEVGAFGRILDKIAKTAFVGENGARSV